MSTGRSGASLRPSPSPPSRPRKPAAYSGTSASGANLAIVAAASSAPRASGRANSASDQTTSAATSVSLEFDCSANAVYGYATQANARGPRGRGRRAHRAGASRRRRGRRSSPGRRRSRRRARRPARPTRRSRAGELEGDIGVVVGGAVGVAEAVVVGEHALAPERVGVGDPVGADRARVADVDHARVGDVDRDPEGDQEDRGEPEPAHRQRRPQPLAAAEADPEHPCEQIDERRVDQRDRDADLAAVEEGLRDPEREQHQQVEVGDPPRAAEVEEAGEEHQRHRDPDPGRVEHVPELGLVAARHRPGDLIAGPGLGDRPGAAVDLDLRHLVVAVLVADLPEVVVVDRDRRGQLAVAGALLGDLRVRVGDLDRLRRRDAEVVRRRRQVVGLGRDRGRRAGDGAVLGRGRGRGAEEGDR